MIGDLNPVPYQPGGGPSRVFAVYDALRRMVGSNGYSADEDSAEAEWRKSKSIGLAMLGTFDERAANQYFPQSATDHIILFEDMLSIPTDETLSDEERRQVILPDYTGVPQTWWSALVEQLRRIDARASIINRLWENAGSTMVGRAFEPFSPAATEVYDTAGNRTATEFPAQSDQHRVVVRYELGSGNAPNREVLRRTVSMQALLNEVLPAWMDFRIIYASTFTLDESLLDATAFGT